jgi:hypothetical protein
MIQQSNNSIDCKNLIIHTNKSKTQVQFLSSYSSLDSQNYTETKSTSPSYNKLQYKSRSNPRKKTCHRGSSSSALNFDGNRFLSLIKENSFLNVFSKKQVFVERPVHLAKIEIDFSLWLREREWDSLYVFDPTTYGSLVQEFYNNSHDIGKESFKSFV